MTLTGDAAQLYLDVMVVANAVHAELEQSAEGMRRTYSFRLKDEKHKKAWELSQKGWHQACHIYLKLCELARQLKAGYGQATLNEAECALLSYAKDESQKALPEIKLTE
jgi:hypothetical protein